MSSGSTSSIQVAIGMSHRYVLNGFFDDLNSYPVIELRIFFNRSTRLNLINGNLYVGSGTKIPSTAHSVSFKTSVRMETFCVKVENIRPGNLSSVWNTASGKASDMVSLNCLGFI